MGGATGSNSKFLSRDVITEFRGRGDEVKIAPLSFSEFMQVFQGSREEALAEFITFGSLPKLFDMPDEKAKNIQSALHLPDEEKWNQELRPLRAIGDSFLKFVITADPVKKHQNEDGFVIMNLFDFLLDENSLGV